MCVVCGIVVDAVKFTMKIAKPLRTSIQYCSPYDLWEVRKKMGAAVTSAGQLLLFRTNQKQLSHYKLRNIPICGT